MTDDELQAKTLARWRELRAAATTAAAAREAERVAIGGRMRDVFVVCCTPKLAAKLRPAPANSYELPSAYRSWSELLPKIAEASSMLFTALSKQFTDLIDIDFAERKALDEAASEVPNAVTCETEGLPNGGLGWCLIESIAVSRYATQGCGAASYARARAAMRSQDLVAIGYRVRSVARLKTGKVSYLGPVSAFEVWAFTCAEGSILARHQSPLTTIRELCHRARNEGVNATALLGVPIEVVIKVNADTARREDAPLVRWETLSEGEDVRDEAR